MSRSTGITLWLCALCLVFAPAPGERGSSGAAVRPPVEFSARVDKASAVVGERITLTLSLESEPQIQVRLPEAGPQITGLRIVDAGEEGPKPVDNRLVQKKWYALQADMAGTYIIPAFTVTYNGAYGTRQELASTQLFIEVTAAPDSRKKDAAESLRDIKPPQDVPWSPGKPLIYSLLAALLLGISGALLMLYRRRKKALPPAPPKPAHVRAFEELEQLTREKLIERGIVREYYFRLSEIFRRYIERRFYIPAVERTTEEIMPDISRLPACAAEVKVEMREILRYADLVKFACFLPDREASDRDYQRVVRVIEKTREEPAAADAAAASAPESHRPC
jgi:hypothetical protein